MPLEILAPMVVIGIAAIAAMLHLSGMSRVAPLTADRVHGDWAAEYPGTPAREITLDDDARVALVQTPQGPGVLWVLGADTAARLFATAPRVTETARGLTIRTGDFTAPRISVRLDDAAARQHWIRALTETETVHT